MTTMRWRPATRRRTLSDLGFVPSCVWELRLEALIRPYPSATLSVSLFGLNAVHKYANIGILYANKNEDSDTARSIPLSFSETHLGLRLDSDARLIEAGIRDRRPAAARTSCAAAAAAAFHRGPSFPSAAAASSCRLVIGETK